MVVALIAILTWLAGANTPIWAGEYCHYPLNLRASGSCLVTPPSTYFTWPTTWQALSVQTEIYNSTDVDNLAKQYDLVSNSTYPGIYYGTTTHSSSSYTCFRLRTAYGGTVINDTLFAGTIFVLFNNNYPTKLYPTHGFAWDTKGKTGVHGLEMVVAPWSGYAPAWWKDTHMDDVDGSDGSKLACDIDDDNQPCGEGYVRTVDSQPGAVNYFV